MTASLRCAIYTRKSSEEGLEQSFNSLHAQREACAAYVLSQAGEGWTALPGEYDDGGYSGGSMDRPGLQALLAGIGRGRIDIVVVYKVDRLTRSLADFARMVELFDAHKVSFVSVTQAFNTTTSMGRLTLNVLLSFAQFEREVTGERIRDKIAASKAKGMWMGGRPPLGYDGRDRKLVVNEVEAAAVRQIFERYVELGTVTALTAELRDAGVRSKRWTMRSGQMMGGAVFTRGALYHLLSNPVYRGAIPHHDRVYEGAHEAIVDQALWERVQALLAENGNPTPADPLAAAPALLQGRLFDDAGHRMGPLHTLRRGRRYRYYVSAALKPASGLTPGSLARIAVGVLDGFVVGRIAPVLSPSWNRAEPPEQRVAAAIERVALGADRIEVVARSDALAARPIVEGGVVQPGEAGVKVVFEIRMKHRQGAVIIEAPGEAPAAQRIDRALLRAVVLARTWANQLAGGEVGSVKELACRNGLCEHYMARLMPLAFLAPDLTTQILEGRQPQAVSLGALTRRPLPLDWCEQRRVFATLGVRAVDTSPRLDRAQRLPAGQRIRSFQKRSSSDNSAINSGRIDRR
jgi:DNA invertase Pin-like site-specific DNA recombinase